MSRLHAVSRGFLRPSLKQLRLVENVQLLRAYGKFHFAAGLPLGLMPRRRRPAPPPVEDARTPLLGLISFAGPSFSVADIGLDVILPLRDCAATTLWRLPMGGVRVTQTDSYYWLIPSSSLMRLAFQPSLRKGRKKPSMGVSLSA